MRAACIAWGMLVACGTAEPAIDANAADDAFVPRECTWIAPPNPGVCDGMGRSHCTDWASATTADSALIAYAYCLNGRVCVAALECPSSGCTCGAEPACAHGSICAVRPGETVPSCIACTR